MREEGRRGRLEERKERKGRQDKRKERKIRQGQRIERKIRNERRKYTPVRSWPTILYLPGPTWKNESGDIWKERSRQVSVMYSLPAMSLYGACSRVHRV